MLELKDVCFTYEQSDCGVQDINVSISQGECVVLIGQSGNGKTTLTRLINGLAPAHYKGSLSGEIRINQNRVQDMPLWELSGLVGSVFQDPKSQFFSGELCGEIAFALENRGCETQEIRKKTDAVIKKTELSYLRDVGLDKISSGEKQKVAIASVLSLSPAVLVLDEPTANLDASAARELGEMLKKLKQAGHTLVLAEHRLSYLSEIADRYLYLQNGTLKKEFTASELQNLPLAEKEEMGIRAVHAVPKPRLQAIEKSEVFLSATRIEYTTGKRKILNSLSFMAEKGQVVALTGKNGCGKTTLAKILCGIYKEKKGEICFGGKATRPRHRFRHVWYSSNDTNTQFFTGSLTEELLLQSPKTEKELKRARDILKRLGLYELRDRHPQTLSGGQKQRLSIACGLFSDRAIQVYDEPTSGLDGKNMKLVSEIFKEMAQQGKLVLCITHDAELMEACCSHEVALST